MSMNYNFGAITKILSNDESWATKADGMNSQNKTDGQVSLSEFKKYIKENWNGEISETYGEYSADLVQKFFISFDTTDNSSSTRNRLDSNELNNLNTNLAVWGELHDFLKEVNPPAGINKTAKAWKAGVTEDLTKKLNDYINLSAEEQAKMTVEEYLQQFLVPISNKHTALCYKDEYTDGLKKNVLKDYPDYYPAEDATLNDLINKYIEQITTPDEEGLYPEVDVIADIKAIIDAYLKTANIGEGSEYDLTELGLDSAKINDLQKEVVKKTIKEQLGDKFAEKYKKFETQFNAAIEKFITEQLENSEMTFEKLLECAKNFDTKELDNLVTIESKYRDVDESEEADSFYQALVTEFGEDVAKLIAKNDRYIKAYNTIIDDVVAKLNAGEIEMDEVQDYIIEQVRLNLEEFLPSGFSDMEVSQLYETYTKLVEAAEANPDADEALNLHREAGIKYCDALVKKGGEYKQLVINHPKLGDNYKANINKLLPGDIQDIIKELNELAVKIVDPKDLVLTWNQESSNYTLQTGASTSIAMIQPTLKNGEEEVNKVVEFSVKDSAGLTTSFVGNTLTINAGDKVGTFAVKVVATIDGVEVGEPFTITINVQRSTENVIAGVKSWGGAESEKLNVKTVNDTWSDGNTVTTHDFASLYNGDAIIELNRHEGAWQWDIITERFTSLANCIVSALATAGLDKDKLEVAAKTVIAKYTDENNRHCHSKRSGSISNNTANWMIDNRETASHKLVVGQDKDGSSTDRATQVYFRDVVDDILAEYWKLVG